jgi:hypothetical protein
MAQWYRWDSLETAQACLDYLNNRPELPLVGKNAKTGKSEPNKTKTTKWCDSVTECTDGKFGFPKIPASFLDYLGIDEAERQQFLDTFQPTIEEFDSAWIPEVEEE